MAVVRWQATQFVWSHLQYSAGESSLDSGMISSKRPSSFSRPAGVPLAASHPTEAATSWDEELLFMIQPQAEPPGLRPGQYY